MAGAVIFNSRAIARRESAGAPNSAICFHAVSLMVSCKFGICFLSVGLTILTPYLLYTVNIQCIVNIVKVSFPLFQQKPKWLSLLPVGFSFSLDLGRNLFYHVAFCNRF